MKYPIRSITLKTFINLWFFLKNLGQNNSETYKNDFKEVPTETFYSTIMHSYLLIFSSFLQRPHQTVIMTVKIINRCVFRQPK